MCRATTWSHYRVDAIPRGATTIAWTLPRGHTTAWTHYRVKTLRHGHITAWRHHRVEPLHGDTLAWMHYRVEPPSRGAITWRHYRVEPPPRGATITIAWCGHTTAWSHHHHRVGPLLRVATLSTWSFRHPQGRPLADSAEYARPESGTREWNQRMGPESGARVAGTSGGDQWRGPCSRAAMRQHVRAQADVVWYRASRVTRDEQTILVALRPRRAAAPETSS